MAGVSVPLQAIEHAYLISEPIEGVSSDLPIFEDPDRFAYFREETGGLLVGLFEPVAAPWSIDKIPDNFSFGEIPSDWDRLAPFLEHAMEIVPGLENVGFVNCSPVPRASLRTTASSWARRPSWSTSLSRPGSTPWGSSPAGVPDPSSPVG